MVHRTAEEKRIAAAESTDTVEVPITRRRATANSDANASLQEIFRKVERAKQEWESAVDSLPELICVTDTRGNIVRANRTAEGWDLAPVISVSGLTFHQLLHPSCKSQACYLDSFVSQSLEKGPNGHVPELEAYDAFIGRHILIKVHPVATKKEMAQRTAVIVVQDITLRKQMEEALRRHTNRLEVMNRIGEAILMVSSPRDIARAALLRMRQLVSFQLGLLTLTSNGSEELQLLAVYAEGGTGAADEEWLPRSAFTQKTRRGLERFLLVEDLAAIANRCPFEERMAAEGVHAYLSIPLFAHGNFIGAFILGANRPNAFLREEIEIANEVGDLLAIAVHQARLKQTLELTNARLERALQAKEEMIQNVSHELRTPLQILKGYATLMREGTFGGLNGDQAEALDVIAGRLDQLNFLVTRLLTLQALDKRLLDFQQLDPQEFLSKLTSSWQLRAENQELQLRLETADDLPKVTADPNLLNLAIGNLVDNAIKFSRDTHGVITIRAWAEEGQLFISVSDPGIGIPQDKLIEIFERFAQVDGSTTRIFGGMGIGLALSHDIIDAHGGRVWAESQGKGQGSTLFIALPAIKGTQV